MTLEEKIGVLLFGLASAGGLAALLHRLSKRSALAPALPQLEPELVPEPPPPVPPQLPSPAPIPTTEPDDPPKLGPIGEHLKRIADATNEWVVPVEILDAVKHPAYADGKERRKVRISDGYHMRGSGKFHKGADFMYRRSKPHTVALPTRSKWHDMPEETRALAAGPGRIATSKQISTGGYIRIEHPGGLQTQYMHLSRLDVQTGDTVRAGQVLGIVGHNVRGYRLNHLHFQLSTNAGKTKIDPAPYVRHWRHVHIPEALV